MSLSSRIQNNHVQDQQTTLIIRVEKLESLSLRKEWMNDLAQAVAFLESLNLAHDNLRPENILLDRNRLKLSDFDYTAEIGTDFEACIAPYGRILNNNETDQGRRGSSGFLDSRTEQFALGFLYYLINYGFEVYRDRYLTEDPKEHGPKVVDLLQNMEFSELDGDPLIDGIINKCWHHKIATVAELAAHTETLFTEKINGTNTETIPTRWRMVLGRIIRGSRCSLAGRWVLMRQSIGDKVTNIKVPNGREANGDSCDVDQDHSVEGFSSKETFCQALKKRGLLHLLSSGEPKQLGFNLEWYRHTKVG